VTSGARRGSAEAQEGWTRDKKEKKEKGERRKAEGGLCPRGGRLEALPRERDGALLPSPH